LRPYRLSPAPIGDRAAVRRNERAAPASWAGAAVGTGAWRVNFRATAGARAVGAAAPSARRRMQGCPRPLSRQAATRCRLLPAGMYQEARGRRRRAMGCGRGSCQRPGRNEDRQRCCLPEAWSAKRTAVPMRRRHRTVGQQAVSPSPGRGPGRRAGLESVSRNTSASTRSSGCLPRPRMRSGTQGFEVGMVM